MKNKLRKTFSGLLAFLIMISVIMPSNVVMAEDSLTSGEFTDEYGNEWKYEPDYSNYTTATGEGGKTYKVWPASNTSVKGEVTIPGKIGDVDVTSFGNYDGWYSTLITEVTIPASITNIESMAFTGWSNLETINFESGSNLKVIQKEAFGGCSKLESITLPASVQEVGVLYTYPEKQTGHYIFGDCSSLTEIQVEEGNTHFKSVDGVLYSYDGTILYVYPANKGGSSYEIPAEVRTINSQAFNVCQNLSSITFAEDSQLTTLGDRVFAHSSKIEFFSEFPTTLTHFGSWVFGGTKWLSNQITPESPFLIINGVLVNAYYNINVPATVSLPAGIHTINYQVLTNGIFGGDTTVIIPASVTTIDNNAFYSNSNISNVIFMEDSNLTTIGAQAFYMCNSITNLKLPGKLTTIGKDAFGYMESLKSIAIPDSVTNIGETILYGDTSLEYIFTDNEQVKTAELHESWNDFHYSFASYDEFGVELLEGEISIFGVVQHGETLSAVTTGITNLDPGAYAYEWYRVDAATGAELIGAIGTAVDYTVTSSDIGHKLKLKVTSANCKGSLTAVTDIVPKIDYPTDYEPANGAVEFIEGVKYFTFSGVVGVDYEYSVDAGTSWRDVTVVSGTTGLYMTGSIHLGNIALEVGDLQVRAKETAIYNASKPITNGAAYIATLEGSVIITGNTRYNETLTANALGYQSNASLIYTWYRSGSDIPIKAGPDNQYTINAADIGKTISVVVTASGYSGNLEAATVDTVSKADAVITIAEGKDHYAKTYGDIDFDLEGISNNVNGLPQFVSSNSEVLTVEEGRVHIVSAGDAIITVSLEETETYHSAVSKTITVSVGKAPITMLSLGNLMQSSDAISAARVDMYPYSKVAYDKIKIEYGAVSGSAITWSDSLPTEAGNYKVRATLLAMDANTDGNVYLDTDIIVEKDFIITNAGDGGSTDNPGTDNPGTGNPGTDNPGTDNPGTGNPGTNNPGTDNPGTGNPGSGGSGSGNSGIGGGSAGPVVTNPTETTQTPGEEKTETEVVTNPDGSVTETETTVKPDGSKTVKEATSKTSSKEDGTLQIVETVKVSTTTADGSTLVITSNTIIDIEADGSATNQSVIKMDNSDAIATKVVKSDEKGNIISSTASIVAAASDITVSKKTATVAVDINPELLKVVADSAKETEVTIDITADATKKALADSEITTVTLAVNVPAVEGIKMTGINLNKDLASQAAENKKDLKLTVTDENGDSYAVKIASDDMAKIDKDINLSLSTKTYEEAKENKKFIKTIDNVLQTTGTKTSEIKIVNFSEAGALGTGMTLTYKVSDIEGLKSGDKVYVYLYNSKTNKLEEVPNNAKVVSKNGTITTSTINGGEFVISAEKLTGDNVTTLVDKTSAKTEKTTIKAGSKTTMKVTLPKEIVKVASFTKNSDPTGKEEAKVTYKVSNKSIASIDSEGNITAKKAGKVKVTVTIKLENGQKKEVTKTITVK